MTFKGLAKRNSNSWPSSGFHHPKIIKHESWLYRHIAIVQVPYWFIGRSSVSQLLADQLRCCLQDTHHTSCLFGVCRSFQSHDFKFIPRKVCGKGLQETVWSLIRNCNCLKSKCILKLCIIDICVLFIPTISEDYLFTAKSLMLGRSMTTSQSLNFSVSGACLFGDHFTTHETTWASPLDVMKQPECFSHVWVKSQTSPVMIDITWHNCWRYVLLARIPSPIVGLSLTLTLLCYCDDSSSKSSSFSTSEKMTRSKISIRKTAQLIS